MEIAILCVCLVALVSNLAVIAMVGAVFWKTCFSPTAKEAEAVQTMLTEAQKKALEEQEWHRQGIENMMHFNGRPQKGGV